LTIVRECRHFEEISNRLTANRRWLFAATTVLLAAIVAAGGWLLIDVYDGLHLTAAANRVVATHLVQPVLGVLR
jgi:hypothetical protein